MIINVEQMLDKTTLGLAYSLAVGRCQNAILLALCLYLNLKEKDLSWATYNDN